MQSSCNLPDFFQLLFPPSKTKGNIIICELFGVLNKSFSNAPETVSGTKQIFIKPLAVHQATQEEKEEGREEEKENIK